QAQTVCSPPFPPDGACAIRRQLLSIAPADNSAGMTDGGFGHATASDQGPTWGACGRNRRGIVRLGRRRRGFWLRRSLEEYYKARSSNQPDHSYPPSLPWAFFSLAVGAPNSGLCLGSRFPSFSSEGKGNQ